MGCISDRGLRLKFGIQLLTQVLLCLSDLTHYVFQLNYLIFFTACEPTVSGKETTFDFDPSKSSILWYRAEEMNTEINMTIITRSNDGLIEQNKPRESLVTNEIHLFLPLLFLQNIYRNDTNHGSGVCGEKTIGLFGFHEVIGVNVTSNASVLWSKCTAAERVFDGELTNKRELLLVFMALTPVLTTLFIASTIYICVLRKKITSGNTRNRSDQPGNPGGFPLNITMDPPPIRRHVDGELNPAPVNIDRPASHNSLNSLYAEFKLCD
ncbi:uncharacterized protein [Panulirus ornatus]|uniref:uncharacterized protein isoform X2 n=1 Tax=Panulirus ornatus TaxID=150431 RepID=UPI003A892684